MTRANAAVLAFVALLGAAAVFVRAQPTPGGSPAPLPADTGSRVIDVGTQAANNSFESLWASYRRADESGDVDGSAKAMQDIRWFRIERNIRHLQSIALALVARGENQLKTGDRAKAEESFRNAVVLDPQLPDAYYGLAAVKLKGGPMGFVSALRDVASAVLAPAGTSEGRYFLFCLAVGIGLLALIGISATFAIAMLSRYGALILHDIEEALGSGSRSVAVGVLVVFLLVPVMTLQGYGWLPLWCITLLFLYFTTLERVVAGLLLAATLVVGPTVRMMEGYVKAQQNPLLRAGLLSVEGQPDARAVGDLTAASAANPDDRDLKYLLALQYKKAGRYDDAAAIYRDIAEGGGTKDPVDLGIALNNLGNIEFARGNFDAAIARYKRAADLPMPNDLLASVYYNKSLAHLQHFEYEAANEARGEADRLNRALAQGYESLWKTERRGSPVASVADLMPSADEVWAKFTDVRNGVGRKNLTGRSVGVLQAAHLPMSLASRFVGFLMVFGVVVFALSRLRGDKLFTTRCQKCGAPFCSKCQLGASVAGLCTQCHHLFVVRDGVSGPARVRKLSEVQAEDDRRNKVFRLLAVFLPGAGQIYGQKVLTGLVLSAIWSVLLAALVMAGNTLPVTQAPASLAGYWSTAFLLLGLIAVYVLGHRIAPSFEFVIPMAQRAPRRMAKAS